MNKSYVLLKIIALFKRAIKRSTVDYDDLVTILSLKLTLDDRKSSPVNSNKSKLTGMKANLLMQGLFGFLMGIMMFMPFDLFYKIAIVAGMDLFFMVLFMISDFSSVLLDTRDKDIIMTKPVTPQTMNAARLIHVIYYMLSLFLALNIISIVILTVKLGAMILVGFALMLILLSFFIIFITTILYSLLLEKFSGEKLKDIINIFQITLSIVTMISYQLVGRIFEFVDFEMVVHIKWWTYLLPPAWYASLFVVIVEGERTSPYLIMSVLGIVIPLIAGGFLIKSILPKYENYLSKLQIEDGVFIPKNSFKTRLKKGLFKLVSSNHQELAFMNFTDANLSRDRKVKLMILPNQALGYLFPLIMILPFLQSSDGLLEGIASLKGSLVYLNVYWAVVMFASNYEFIQYSEKYEASFIYDTFPIEDKNTIVIGALKAYYIKYMLPGMLMVNVIFLLLSGPESLLGLLITDVMSVFLLILRYKLSSMELPFSKEIASTGNKNVASTFGLMAIAGILAGLQFLVVKNNFIAGVIVLFLAVLLTWWSYIMSFVKSGYKAPEN